MTKKGLKNNNSGFSLVELIVSITILAVIIGPLLYSFIVSQRIANKSFTLGDATLASRNVIETVRANGVDSVVSDVATGFSPFGTGSSVDIDSDYGVWDPDSGVFTFLVRDIPAGTLALTTTGSSADMSFDAIVSIDSSVYRPGLNDMLISEYIPMDAMFIQDRTPGSDPDELAIEEFANRLDMLGVINSVDAVTGNYDRIIELFAEIESGNVKVTVTYRYTFNYPGLVNNTYDIEYYDIYWDTYDPDYPLTLYLYYRPYYGNLGTEPDTIEIYNLNMLDLTVFVIKQMPIDDPPLDPGNFSARELGYRALIRRIENQSLQSVTGSGRTKVQTNFRQNFAGGSVNTANFEQKVRYGTVWLGTVTVNTASDELVAQSERDRMFAVNVEVYNQWELGAVPMLEFSATHLE